MKTKECILIKTNETGIWVLYTAFAQTHSDLQTMLEPIELNCAIQYNNQKVIEIFCRYDIYHNISRAEGANESQNLSNFLDQISLVALDIAKVQFNCNVQDYLKYHQE